MSDISKYTTYTIVYKYFVESMILELGKTFFIIGWTFMIFAFICTFVAAGLTSYHLGFSNLVNHIVTVFQLVFTLGFLSYMLFFSEIRKVFLGVSVFAVLWNIRSNCLLYNKDTINEKYLEHWCENNCNGRYFLFKNNIVGILKNKDGSVTIKFGDPGIIFSSKDDLVRFRMAH